MLISKESLVIVRSTIELAHELGKKVIAEGIETKDQLESLSILGCDIAQGYFIARPMQEKVFLDWIKTTNLH
jgi:EAL domain-containing protein (putative c-di-GMP-specific phosphodiesterase class I)